MTNRVLVTGASGFIGRHLTSALVREGYAVHALVQDLSQAMAHWPSEIRREIHFIEGNICDAEGVREWVEGKTQVFHLAGLVSLLGGGESQALVENNVTGTLNVLHAALAHNSQVLHTSCSEVYGQVFYAPVDEKHPLMGRSHFAATKIAADMLVESFQRSFQLPVAVLRPFHLLGSDLSQNSVFGRLYQLLCDWESEAGPSTRQRALSAFLLLDFVHVSDLVQAYLQLARTDLHGQVYNIARGKPVALSTLGLWFQQQGQPVNPKLSLATLKTPAHAKIDRARQDLNFNPEIGLEQGWAESLAGWRKN